MIMSTFWLTLILIMILGEIYLLSRYILVKNVIFQDNKYASFVSGVIIYLFITFISFFFFIWVNLNIFYLVVIFWIKEVMTWTFLVLKRNEYIDKLGIREFLYVVFASIFIVIIHYFGISKLTNPIEIPKTNNFQTIFIFNDVIDKITHIGINNIKDWFTPIIVSIIAFSSIAALIREFSYQMGVREAIIALVLTIVSLMIFSFKLPLWISAEVYLAPFIILLSIRIISFSRRRYGVLFAITALTCFMFGYHLRIGLWGLALVVMIIYTILKKPQNSLFWVMLVSPLLMIEGLRIYEYSELLAFVLFALSFILYTFMLSLQGVWVMKVLNGFFEKYRFITPLILFLSLFISFIITIVNKDILWNDLVTFKSPVLFSLTDNSYYKWFTFSLSIVIILITSLRIFIKVHRNERLNRTDYVYLTSLLLILFLYNPIFNALFSVSTFASSFQYTLTLIYLPIMILFITETNIVLRNIKK